MLRVEQRVWEVYLKTEHFSIKRFEFGMIKPFSYDTTRKAQKLALILLQAGWSPYYHSKKTRENYKNVSYIENLKTVKSQEQLKLNF